MLKIWLAFGFLLAALVVSLTFQTIGLLQESTTSPFWVQIRHGNEWAAIKVLPDERVDAAIWWDGQTWTNVDELKIVP